MEIGRVRYWLFSGGFMEVVIISASNREFCKHETDKGGRACYRSFGTLPLPQTHRIRNSPIKITTSSVMPLIRAPMMNRWGR
jgi:hypothetical protein